MGAILKWIVGPIAGPVFGIAAVLLAVGWLTNALVDRAELASVRTERDHLKAEIYDPSTGYLARNTQCETNVAGLTVGLDHVRADVQKLADDTKASDANLRAAMARQGAIAGATKAAADKLLALPAPAAVGTLEACTAAARVLKTGAP